MRLSVTKSKNATSFYVIESVYNPKTQKNTSRIVEKLGTEEELKQKLDNQDPYLWAKDYVQKLNAKEKEKARTIMLPLSEHKQLEENAQHCFKGGYLFLQKIYTELGIDQISKEISQRYKFKYDLDAILSRLVYSRILFPTSKKGSYEVAGQFLEASNFELHQVYRALSILANEMDMIQAQLYENSLKQSTRNTGVIYYDCTNFFFEIEEADPDGDRKYGVSKENRPNPIVQMGLFMDADGIPLAFCINPGNTSEQVTLQPLEKRIIQDFGLSKFVVCTDAGLSSMNNRKFNNTKNRAYITTQSIKTLKKYQKDWALDPKGWRLSGSSVLYDITNLDEEKDLHKIFYKERWINEDGIEQRLIVTFSLKYKCYQENIRNGQVMRAQKSIDSGGAKKTKKNANDYRRFIDTQNTTPDGEVAENKHVSIDQARIDEESQYDGFYGVCTNLEDSPETIVKVNQGRWEIEESFRIMKSEFKARPAYLHLSERIRAHFLTCFLALTVYRYLEKRVNNQYTCSELTHTLRDMNFLKTKSSGYIPTYTRTAITDALHDAFGFRTDYEIISEKNMRKIFKATKS